MLVVPPCQGSLVLGHESLPLERLYPSLLHLRMEMESPLYNSSPGLVLGFQVINIRSVGTYFGKVFHTADNTITLYGK